MNLEETSDLQDEMNQTLKRLGLGEWTVIFMPGKKHEVNERVLNGQVLPKDKTILIFSKDAEKAKDTLLHEFLEIKLQPLIAEYRETSNHLIKVIERLLYREKERTIKDLIPLLRYVYEENGTSSTPESTGRERKESPPPDS